MQAPFAKEGSDFFRYDTYYKGPVKNTYLYILFFALQTAVYIWLVFYFENKKNILQEEQSLNELDEELADVEPEVLEEEERLADPECKDIVKVHKLSKQYPNGFTAIRNNNFGV